MSRDYSTEIERFARVAQPYLPYALFPLGLYGAAKLLSYLIPGAHRQRKMNLKDRTVLITGASTGLGRAMAFVFYEKGAKVILTARSIEQLQALCEELQKTGQEKGWNNPHKPEFKYLDLVDLVDDAVATKQLNEIKLLALNDGRIDVLINNAGLSNRGSCVDTDVSVQRKIFDVNYFGAVAVTKAVYDAIPDDGAIVTIGSIQSKVALPYRSAYSASKHAITAFMDSLRAEDRPALQVLNVYAGYMNTGFGSRALTADGKTHGIQDKNQLKGYTPEYSARTIILALCNRKSELILAPITSSLAIWLRLLTPNFLNWILHRRATKEIAEYKQQKNE
ncbi:unnamed protein product [Bursaphelenchus xylophilus]|uniref:(pine wood nematode) hypothetical protein n=1 Tax=Bursaphelenchus xylophilus TaxID=6326 RepID=A0A1I7RRD3_BURXY|nr:unnamed protein product [Bursaphelenchus xylophilus]CAG9130955.1 unnamed protein product [Bursaphelenchus xylophilus]